MQTAASNKPQAFMAPTSSMELSGGELDRHQPALAVVKRKRTKRPRHHHHPPASSASSSESTTTEEEDMAHCLILLAQGGAGVHAAVDSKPSPAVSAEPPQQAQAPSPPIAAPPPVVKSERYTSRKYTEAATTADGVRAGFYVYECKTCNKCFPTFQALGGHRASHKKPRLPTGDENIANAINNVVVTTATKQNHHKPPMTTASPPPPRADVTTALTLHSTVAGSSSKLRVHECSICSAEFASGQALGGHMRRHRPLNAPERAVTAAIAMDTTRKEGSASINLELDLNLPAPSDEEAVSLPPVVLGLGQFNDGNKAGLMLTASALVDCHY